MTRGDDACPRMNQTMIRARLTADPCSVGPERQVSLRARQPVSAATAHAIACRLSEDKRPNHEAAFVWFSRAAVAGYAPAMTRMAEALAEGRGVRRDPAMALRWYRRASAAGDAGAQATVGWIDRHLEATLESLATTNGNQGQSHAL